MWKGDTLVKESSEVVSLRIKKRTFVQLVEVLCCSSGGGEEIEEVFFAIMRYEKDSDTGRTTHQGVQQGDTQTCTSAS